METLLLVLDLVGTFVFALSGATAGVKHRLDLFGVLVLSYAAGNAGGIARDLLIGAVPPAAISDWRYLGASERFDNELDLIGTPDEVADKMAAAMGFVGGDGFLISTPFQRTSRRYINEVCEGLVTALQRRGLVRETYTRSTLRETLREF
jgi:alkanesulfonate monooxygenase SsuD/methylene tetrahydromethanopterin reductase-like flavin-dependent oxidoreductase (luciferase family)